MPPRAGRKTVLIVDDQPDIRLLCRANLALEGYDVIEAADGESCLEAAFSRPPDVILLDIMMPGMDGWQVLDALKAQPATAHVPVVLLTAKTQREDEIRGWRGDAADFLTKPFNPSTLTEVLRRVLNRSDHEDRRRRALQKLSILSRG